MQPDNVKIITFEITPYSDDVSNYINSLSHEELYKVFNSKIMTPDVLTCALKSIYEIESKIRRSLLNNEDVTNMYPIRTAQLVCKDSYTTLNKKVLNSLGDVYLRDELLFNSNLNTLSSNINAFVMLVNDIYSAHIYSWIVYNNLDSIVNIIGIRSSIYQLLISPCNLRQRGVANILIDAIYNWYKDATIFRVLQPIGPMPAILNKCGFTLSNKYVNNNKMKWIFNNASLGDVSMTRMLIFREYDYILEANKELKCQVPYYIRID